MIAYLYHRIRAGSGEASSVIIVVIFALLVLGSYMMYPGVYHGFVHWLMDHFFDGLNSSFGGGEEKPPAGQGKNR